MAFSFFQNWPETIATIVLVIGFILASFFTSAVITYVVVFLCGMLIGRLWYRKKGSLKFPLFLILMGLLVGLVIGSRYTKGGKIEGWNAKRKIMSKAATLLARIYTKIKDPMTGFFMIKRECIKNVNLNPQGFKILL